MIYKHLKYFTVLFLLAIFMPLSVNASEKAKINVDKTELEAGDSVVVTVDLDYDKPLYAFTAGLSFDENVFEVLEPYNFEEQDEWSDISYNKKNNEFALLNKTGDTKKHLLALTLFVKENPRAGETKISLKDPIASDGTEDIEFSSSSKTLIVNKGKDVSSYSKKEETKAENTKKVTTTKPMIAVGSVLLCLFLIVIIYINSKYSRKYIVIRENRKPITLGIVATMVILFGILFAFTYINSHKGDVDNDGKTDYNDARKINEYLIGITNEKEDEDIAPAYDINNDGVITIGDTALATKNTKKSKHIVELTPSTTPNKTPSKTPNTPSTAGDNKTPNKKYNAELNESKFNYYPEKGSVINLAFSAKINPNDVKIKEVYINGKKYKVSISGNNYIASVKAPDNDGIYTYTITKVILTNGNEINVKDISFTVDVLKDRPAVTNFNNDTKSISFEFLDNDNTLKNAHIKIAKGIVSSSDFNSEDNDDVDDIEAEIIYDQELNIKSKNVTINLDLDLGENYTVLITGSYDLDTNKLDNTSNYYKNHEFYFNTFTNAKVTINPITDLTNLFPEQNEPFEFDFDLDIKPNNLNKPITSIVIDGETKNVIRKGDHYAINIDGANSHGEQIHKITSVTLDDGREIICNYDIIYDVLRETPTISDFVYHDKANRITFTLNDKDLAMKNAKIIITKKDESKPVLEKTLELHKTNYVFNDINLDKGAKYDVKITGEYDLDSDIDNGKNDFNGTLYFHELTIYDVVLTNAGDDIYDAGKGANVTLKFKAETVPENNDDIITEVTINGNKYVPNYDQDGTYSVNITAPLEAGKKSYTIEKLLLGDDEISKELSFMVDVLKDKPEIINFNIDESKSSPELTFNLKDEDNALDTDKPGYIVINDAEGNEIKTDIAIKKGDNKFTLENLIPNLDKSKTYYLDVKVNYNLNSYDNTKNEHKDFKLIDNHEIKFYTAALSLISDDLYVNKNVSVPVYMNARITPTDGSVNIKSFVMKDGTEVPAGISENNYYINIDTLDVAGTQTYNIEKVILTNDIEVKAPLVIETYVLKDKPYVNKLNLNDDNKSLSYELTDNDEAFKNGTITIYDKDNRSVKNDTIENSGIINYNFNEDEEYSVKVVGSYDLDDETNNKNEVNNQEMSSQSFMIGGDYNFELTEASITDALQTTEKPVITFNSSNTRNALVKTANLTKDNSKTSNYNVNNISDSNYEIILNDADMAIGKHTVTLNSVQLDTAKTYTNNTDYKVNTLTYTVLKKAPSVSNINLTNNSADKTITASFDVNDTNLALKGLTALLVDSSNRIIDGKSFTMEEIFYNRTVTLTYGKNTDGKYKVKFVADYDLSEKYKYNNQNIGENEIFIQNNDIYIKSIVPNKKSLYVTKGTRNFELNYDVYVGPSIKTPVNNKNYTRLSGVTVNGVNYVANQVSGFTSKIGVIAPDEAGVIKFTADKVQLELNTYYDKQTNYYSVPAQSIYIEVLRDIPKIENLEIVKEDYTNGTVTFKFDVKIDEKAKDDQDGFYDGIVELNGAKEKIKEGQNTVTFNDVQKDQNLDLIFKASYDLDTDALNEDDKDENEYKDAVINSVKYGLFSKDTYNDIKVTDGKAVSENNNNYFQKNEKIKLNFNITGDLEKLGVTPEKVIIKGVEYNLTKLNDGYEIVLDGYKTFGEKTVDITDIILNNGKKITLEKAYTIKPEILKDIPKIVDYKYNVGNKITVTTNLKDTDGAIVGKAKIKVTDESGKTLYNDDYSKEIEFDKKDDLRYYVEIVADYDRDTDTAKNSENYYENKKLLDEIISLETNNIELKEILDVSLYKKEKSGGEEEINLKENVDIADLEKNKNAYFAEIKLENMPSIYAKIKEIKKENNQLVLILDYEYVIKENSKENIKIVYGSIDGNEAKNETHPDLAFKSLLEKLEKNENVTLMQNYDASDVSTEEDYYIETYSGILNGNGYKIKNLKKPLFKTINNEGTVKNLSLENITLPDNRANGAIANTATNATFENILIDNFNRAGDNGPVGSIVGSASKVTIENCRSINFTIRSIGGWATSLQQVGGLVGSGSDVTIKNSYAKGFIKGGWNFRAGLVGNVGGSSTFENNFTSVNIDYAVGDGLVCGLVCNGGSSTFKNNISLNTGSIRHKMYGGAKVSENNYYLGLETDEDLGLTGVSKITEDKVNTKLFKDTLEFNEKIWNLKDISYKNLPSFQIEKISSVNGDNNEKYDEANETLYSNLTKLMPFYDSDKIIESAIGITDNNLKNKEISHILPVDANGNLVTYLTTDDIKKINKIKIVYKTGEHQEYKVTYDNNYDMIASYRIPSLKIDYTYNHYVIDADSQVVNDLTNYLKGLNYTASLDVLTSTEDSRIYRDFYNDVTSKELREFVLKFLSNSNYTNTTNNENINSYIERAVKKDNKIEKVLYMYNYLRRFYDLEIDGMKLYDFVLFNMQGFDKSLTPEKVTDLYLANGDNFKTSTTGSTYKNLLGGYTGFDTIAKFIEYLVTEFGDGNLDEWTRQQFKGYLVEIPVKVNGETFDKVQYTLWDHFINQDIKGYNSFDRMLPILTLPKNAAYIISTPVQFVIGAQRSYIDNPDDPKQQSLFQKRVMSYAKRMATYYDTAYKILGDETLFNNIHTWHHDKRFAYDENGAMVYQQVGTDEPFHKNYNEVTGYWQTSDGNAAVAWGDRIDWAAEGLLDGNIDPDLVGELNKEIQEYTYHTFTHETAHNIDARLFLKNYGRRYDAGGEDYADDGFMQAFNKNDIVMNLSVDRSYKVNANDVDINNKNWNVEAETGSNYTPQRIDSKDKIYDYYSKVYDTIYVMDYIEAQAFLALTPAQKAEIGIQITYPNENEKFAKDANDKIIPDGKTYKEDPYARFRARLRTGFNQRSAEEWSKLKLNSIDDLINNQIMIYPGIYKYGSRGDNSYGGEGINTVHWYQPNNPDGRPDSYALKWIAYEMLGYKGYDEGFIEYYSNVHAGEGQVYNNLAHPEKGVATINNYKTDNMAIKRISDGAYNNIDEYKKARFKQTESKLKNLNKIINIQEYTQKLYIALVQDSQWASWKLEQLLNAYNTDVNGCLGNYWCSRAMSGEVRGYPFSSRVRQEIYYKLKHATNDFESGIFTNEVQKVDFTIDKSKAKDHYEFNANGTLKETNTIDASPVAVGLAGMNTEDNDKIGENPEQKANKNEDEATEVETKGKLENDNDDNDLETNGKLENDDLEKQTDEDTLNDENALDDDTETDQNTSQTDDENESEISVDGDVLELDFPEEVEVLTLE